MNRLKIAAEGENLPSCLNANGNATLFRAMRKWHYVSRLASANPTNRKDKGTRD
jgi:hypothetical protein